MADTPQKNGLYCICIQNADKIIVMDDGKVNGFGTHEELLAKNGFYADLYNSQFEDCNDGI